MDSIELQIRRHLQELLAREEEGPAIQDPETGEDVCWGWSADHNSIILTDADGNVTKEYAIEIRTK